MKKYTTKILYDDGLAYLFRFACYYSCKLLSMQGRFDFTFQGLKLVNFERTQTPEFLLDTSPKQKSPKVFVDRSFLMLREAFVDPNQIANVTR